MRKRSAANSAASSPPVPALISTMTFLSSRGSFGHQERLQLLHGGRLALLQARQLLPGHLLQLLVPGALRQLRVGGDLRLDGPVAAELLHQVGKGRVLLAQLAVAFLVADDVGVRYEGLELLVSLAASLELVDHVCLQLRVAKMG